METKPMLYLSVDNTKKRTEPEQPARTAKIKPHINNDRVFRLLTIWAAVFELKVCFIDHINYRGEKLYGLYDGGKKRIYLNKHLKGYKLQFMLMHELAHAILHNSKLGPRYWSDPKYRRQLEDEANDYATKILNLLRSRNKKPNSSNFQALGKMGG